MQPPIPFHVIFQMALGILFVVLVFKSGLLAYIYDIKITREGIEFLLFSRFVTSILRFDNINEVIEPRGGGLTYLTAYNFKNRLGVGCFLIRKKRAWFASSILVTPPDRAIFIAALRDAGVPVLER
jgi:hypothetical protein